MFYTKTGVVFELHASRYSRVWPFHPSFPESAPRCASNCWARVNGLNSLVLWWKRPDHQTLALGCVAPPVSAVDVCGTLWLRPHPTRLCPQETSMLLLTAICETLASKLAPLFGQVYTLLDIALKDPVSNDVRIQAMKVRARGRILVAATQFAILLSLM